ncbi:unnamed protein product [Pleuronectes platessa]|uniref:Uncharacterized protein n=1 Tax=Pleuronectes platessa TaxID=8262 RepID=A0A9N7TYA0_PLEPL|nr:unnamed protein product [Pleuronectes platessa]
MAEGHHGAPHPHPSSTAQTAIIHFHTRSRPCPALPSPPDLSPGPLVLRALNAFRWSKGYEVERRAERTRECSRRWFSLADAGQQGHRPAEGELGDMTILNGQPHEEAMLKEEVLRVDN